jgi:hypothetical protein
MSRGFEYDDREFGDREPESESQSRMPLSQGRGGGSSATDQPVPPTFDLQDLRDRIDRSADGTPTVEEFLDRLENEGVHPVPSIQSNGRWSGMSYEFAGVRVRGSELGRAYTAIGLQKKKGVAYDPARDDTRLRALAPAIPKSQSLDLGIPHARDRSQERPLLSSSQERTLWDAGRFRIVATPDLAREHYNGDYARLQKDLTHLAQLKLIERHTIPTNNRGGRLSVVTLTKAGKRVVSASELNRGGSTQAIYAGVVKPRESAHDSAIYRMYLAEARRIEAEGGHVRRVILDYEFKKDVYSVLAGERDLPPLAQAERQREVAEDNKLPVVEGHVVFPDLRVEYEMPDGELRHIDLELATRNYRAAHIRSKAAGGFKVYVDTSSGRLAAVLNDHNLIGELLKT